MLLVSSLVLASCGGSEKSNGPSGNPPPTATPAGAPVGPLVTATIGPAGGNLQSDDGLVGLEVPAGALGVATEIGIQRISTEAPGGVGETVRLTPDGLQFSAPVTIRMAYDSAMADGSASALTTIATQQPDGTWLLLDDGAVSRDTLNAELVFRTTHFSDYTRLQGLQIRPPSGEIDPGGSIGLAVMNCTTIVEQSTGTFSAFAIDCEDAPTNTPPGEDELPALPTYRVDEASWAANGVRGGNAVVGFVAGDRRSAEFIGPQAPPAGNPVAVSVRVRDRNDRTVSTLVANIKIRNACVPSTSGATSYPAGARLFTAGCAPPTLGGTSRSVLDDANPTYRITATVTWVYDSANSIPGLVVSYSAVGNASFAALNGCIQIAPSQHSWQLSDQQSGGRLALNLADSTWSGTGSAGWPANYTDTCIPNPTPVPAGAGGSWFAGNGRFDGSFQIRGTQTLGGQTFIFDFAPVSPTIRIASRKR